MRLDLRKLRFRQPKLVATHLCLLFGSRESRHYVRANTFMGPDPKVAGEEIVAFDLSASVHQHQKIAKAIRQPVHNWLIQALEAVTEPRHHREPVRYPVGPDG